MLSRIEAKVLKYSFICLVEFFYYCISHLFIYLFIYLFNYLVSYLFIYLFNWSYLPSSGSIDYRVLGRLSMLLSGWKVQLLISVFLLQSVLHNIKYKCVKVPFGWHRFSLLYFSLFLFSFFLSFFLSFSLSVFLKYGKVMV